MVLFNASPWCKSLKDPTYGTFLDRTIQIARIAGDLNAKARRAPASWPRAWPMRGRKTIEFRNLITPPQRGAFRDGAC